MKFLVNFVLIYIVRAFVKTLFLSLSIPITLPRFLSLLSFVFTNSSSPSLCLFQTFPLIPFISYFPFSLFPFIPSFPFYLTISLSPAASMTPGLWMAPFACDIHSTLAKDHPDWILKRDCRLLDFKKKGEKVPANSANCGKWFFGLVCAVLGELYYILLTEEPIDEF